MKTYLLNLITGLGYQFYHGERDWQNLSQDEAVFPNIYLDDPIKWTYSFKFMSSLTKIYTLVFVINHKSKLDNSPTEHQVPIDSATLMADRLINALRQDSNIEEVSEVQAVEFTNFFDVNTSGVILMMKIKPINDSSICV